MSIPPLAAATFWIAVILGLAAGVFLLSRRLLRQSRSHQWSANELLADFRELHETGELTDNEYKKIRTKLGSKLQEEVAVEGVSDLQDAAAALKETARSLLAGQSDQAVAKVDSDELAQGDSATESDGSVAHDQTNGSDTEGGTGRVSPAEQEGCDEPPPTGGDSTEGSR